MKYVLWCEEVGCKFAKAIKNFEKYTREDSCLAHYVYHAPIGVAVTTVQLPGLQPSITGLTDKMQ